jgi:uncharacterized protein YjbI with pentapeptide repeats
MLTAEKNETFTPDFGGARLTRANLERANLSNAKAQFVDFREANLKQATAVGALLQGADLRHANLQFADFSRSELKGANLAGANLCGTDLRSANGLTQAQLDGTFGDAATMIPTNLAKPDHWLAVVLDDLDATLEWHKWQSLMGTYIYPEPPAQP